MRWEYRANSFEAPDPRRAAASWPDVCASRRSTVCQEPRSNSTAFSRAGAWARRQLERWRPLACSLSTRGAPATRMPLALLAKLCCPCITAFPVLVFPTPSRSSLRSPSFDLMAESMNWMDGSACMACWSRAESKCMPARPAPWQSIASRVSSREPPAVCAASLVPATGRPGRGSDGGGCGGASGGNCSCGDGRGGAGKRGSSPSLEHKVWSAG
mmetsp:Transcript_79644/g.234251  ORF Transcript_79644/g.234251 Transcript_79644/m.234251 type:complete len:214 (-) Transcript_79644:1071-1712(-)